MTRLQFRAFYHMLLAIFWSIILIGLTIQREDPHWVLVVAVIAIICMHGHKSSKAAKKLLDM